MIVKLAVQTLSSKVAADMSKFEMMQFHPHKNTTLIVKNSGSYLMTQNQSEMKMILQEFKCLMRSLTGA